MILQIQPWIDEAEIEELKKIAVSTFVVEHDLTREFERRIRELTGAKHAIATSSGTTALFCALKALGIGPGDEVIVPAMTFIASANAVILAGGTPVFCDVLPDTFCMDPDKAEELINGKTKVLMPVHLYGQSADMERIMELAGRRHLRVLEDAAQGTGVRFNDRHCGTFGDIGTLAFYGNKTVTTGEGGMVLTNSDDLAQACFRLKNHGRDKKGTFIHEHIGYNFSFTEMQAAVGISQMRKFPAIVAKKQRIHDRYVKELGGLPRFRPVHIDSRCNPVFWFTSFVSEDVEALAENLLRRGIQTRRFFYPLHQQPCYHGLYEPRQALPVTEQIYRQGLSLPSSYILTDDEQGQVIQGIKEFYG